MYQHITLKELRPQLPKVMNQVDSALDRYIVSRHGVPIAVVMAMDDFESLIETLNEISDKENLKKIKKGMKEAKAGKTVSWEKVKSKYHV